MTDDVSKLPAWPDVSVVDFQDTHQAEWYAEEERDAYKARMEALMEYAQHDDACEKWDPENEGLSDTLQCTCGLDALLAACEREEGR